MLWTTGRLALFIVVAFSAANFAPNAFADEPAKRFLNRLREEGYYDLGLKYLDTSAAKNRLPPSMKADLPLERNILLQQSLRTVKTLEQREERSPTFVWYAPHGDRNPGNSVVGLRGHVLTKSWLRRGVQSL